MFNFMKQDKIFKGVVISSKLSPHLEAFNNPANEFIKIDKYDKGLKLEQFIPDNDYITRLEIYEASGRYCN